MLNQGSDIDLLIENISEATQKAKLSALLEQQAFTTPHSGKTVKPSWTCSRCSRPRTFPSPHSWGSYPLSSPRQTILSHPSPLFVDPNHCTLTYRVIDQPNWSDGKKRFLGVTGNYSPASAGWRPGARRCTIHEQVLPTARRARHNPILMFCAGSGLAPFRGFVQERAILAHEGGRKLAPAILFVGCRSATGDRLYAKEFEDLGRGWDRGRAVRLQPRRGSSPRRRVRARVGQARQRQGGRRSASSRRAPRCTRAAAASSPRIWRLPGGRSSWTGPRRRAC